MKILFSLILLLIIIAVVGFIYSNTTGYQARVRAWSERKAIDAQVARDEAKILIATKEWQAQIARDDFERTRTRMIAEAESDSSSPLRKVL